MGNAVAEARTQLLHYIGLMDALKEIIKLRAEGDLESSRSKLERVAQIFDGLKKDCVGQVEFFARYRHEIGFEKIGDIIYGLRNGRPDSNSYLKVIDDEYGKLDELKKRHLTAT